MLLAASELPVLLVRASYRHDWILCLDHAHSTVDLHDDAHAISQRQNQLYRAFLLQSRTPAAQLRRPISGIVVLANSSLGVHLVPEQS